MRLYKIFLLSFLFICSAAEALPKKILTTSGLGNFKFGLPLQSINKILHVKIIPPPTSLRANSNCYYTQVKDIAGVYFVFINDYLKRIDIDQSNIVTEDGILIGDSQSVVERKVHGAIKTPLDHIPTGISITKFNQENGNAISYQIYENKINRIIAGDKNVVQFSEGCD